MTKRHLRLTALLGSLILLRKPAFSGKHPARSPQLTGTADKEVRQEGGFLAAALNSCERRDNSLDLLFIEHRWLRLMQNEEVSCVSNFRNIDVKGTRNKNHVVPPGLRGSPRPHVDFFFPSPMNIWSQVLFLNSWHQGIELHCLYEIISFISQRGWESSILTDVCCFSTVCIFPSKISYSNVNETFHWHNIVTL